MNIVRKFHHYLITGIVFSVLSSILLVSIHTRLQLPREGILILYTALVFASNLIGGLIPGILTSTILAFSIFFNLGPPGGFTDILFAFLFLFEGVLISFMLMKFNESIELVNGVVKSITDPLMVFDKSWKCVYFNKQAQILFNKKDGELMNKNIRKVLPEVVRNPMYSKVLHSVSNNKHMHYVYYSKAVDTWIDANLYPSGRGLAILFMDITHQKHLESQLKESEMGFKKLIDSNIIGVAIEDFEGNVHYANDVYLGLIGYSRADLKKHSVNRMKVTPSEYISKDEAMGKLLLRKGSIEPYEKEYIQKNGNRISVLKGAVLLDKIKKTTAVFALDISARTKREKRKDEFLSFASHELKTPITSIKGFAQMLMRYSGLKNDDKSASYLSRMINQINRLTYLVNDILDIRKIEDNKLILNKDFIDINQLVEDAVKEVHLTAPSHVITWVPARNAMIFGDYNRIYQALLNLLSNAVKYSSSSEKIEVTVGDKTETITIAVADKGIGIPKEKQNHIFEKFFRVEEKTRTSTDGMGIGLYISSEIIKKHGGKIWVDSPTAFKKDNEGKKAGYGSTFYFSLPKHNKN